MSQFQSLDELVQASESHAPLAPASPPAAKSSVVAAKRLSKSPRVVKKRTRLTATPDFASPVSEFAPGAGSGESACDAEVATQNIVGREVVTHGEGESQATEVSVVASAGGQESQNPVNHTQVVVSSEFPGEMQQLLAKIGVNLTVRQVGRKNVLDEFMRGRLVSLLALGLTLRQSAAALGLSHNAIWRELKKNDALLEEVNAARFQAQIEPLLVILRESKRSWRAATWLINYLSKSLAKGEKVLDEQGRMSKEDLTEFYRHQAEVSAIRQREHNKATRKLQDERLRELGYST